jgi:hypothetical protein
MCDDYFCKPELRERGWTDGLIKRLLGEPDQWKRNPHYRSGPQMGLYLCFRVQAAEAEHQAELDDARKKRSRRCEAAQKAAKTRCEAAQKAAKTKRRKIMRESLNAIKLQERLPLPELVKRACAHYNALPPRRRYSRHDDREDDWGDDWEYFDKREASPDSDKSFLDRICVNYIRHALTDYDYAISERGKVGGRLVYQPVRRKVFEEIAKMYPEFAEECQRQME